MEQEKIFNLYIYIQSDRITEIGAVAHTIDGSDEEKLNFLREHVNSDIHRANHFSLPEGYQIIDDIKKENALAPDLFREMLLNGSYMYAFEPVFTFFNATDHPLMCITYVIDGQIVIPGTGSLTSMDPGPPPHFERHRKPDWLIEYTSSEGLDISNLINDDFLKAIKLLYNDKRYASALKLKLSFIDTIAFLEYGDVQGNFQRWLRDYCDLASLCITPEELWELRNSILHMTNLESRKVQQKSVRGIGFYVSGYENDYYQVFGERHCFNFAKLILIIGSGLSKWLDTYNNNPSKREMFVIRYDSLLSDIRYELRSRI
jgi:hypothetical protein